MAFRKAKAEQAALKMGIYGASGSGKTVLSLLVAEGLAGHYKKRIAYVDTERGTDFYCQAVPERKFHPAAWDFDAIYTRSITEVTAAIKKLDPNEHGVVVIDSITHIWEAAINAYSGKQTKIGTIPMHAWGNIKKPYKELINYLMSSPLHFIICGRQGNEYTTDETTDEVKMSGTKMKAEGETPYEPHILIHMEGIRPKANAAKVPTAFIEKDRTGLLQGKIFPFPTFSDICAPILPLFGGQQARVDNDDAVAAQDATALGEQERARRERSEELLSDFNARFDLARSAADVEKVSKEITKELKEEMLPAHVTSLRDKYHDRLRAINGGRRLVGANHE